MEQKLRISVADDEPDMQQFFREVLPRLGHEVVSVAGTGRELVADCARLGPDLVITDVRMQDMDGLDAAEEIWARAPTPIVIVSAYHDASYVERAEASHVVAYLVKPIRTSNLVPAIAVAVRRFGEFEELRRETEGLRQALEDRKVIERAKGILMREARLDEEAAFRRLQRLASRNRQRLVEVARSILVTADALRADPDDPTDPTGEDEFPQAGR